MLAQATLNRKAYYNSWAKKLRNKPLVYAKLPGSKDPANTLLIFDEVQEVPKALTSLKYFNADAPQYQIICAGSLLGVALHQGTSFPVGRS